MPFLASRAAYFEKSAESKSVCDSTEARQYETQLLCRPVPDY